jgi:hypothetical protein
VEAKFNALTAHASTISLNALQELALLAPLLAGTANARLPSADALPESLAQMSSQLSVLTEPAKVESLPAPATLNAQSSSRTDAVMVNAEPAAKTAHL